MKFINRSINFIEEVSKVPSFSSFEERLHPLIKDVFNRIEDSITIDVSGNSLIYRIPGDGNNTVALSAHLDKINHYGKFAPKQLPFRKTDEYLEGAMDNSVGLGILLAFAELAESNSFPDLVVFFTEMEESKGFKEHPELLKNNGKDYEHGRGAKRICERCLDIDLIPDVVVTVDTTPLFEGETGVALYSRHWELNEIEPSDEMIAKTKEVEQQFLLIDENIKLANNTNDYLHFGKHMNQSTKYTVPSVALEPAIFPYHQKGERVFISDIKRVINILNNFLANQSGSDGKIYKLG